MPIQLGPSLSNNVPMICYTDKKQERNRSKYYAPMEERTLKIRDKLEKRLDQIEKKITEEKLAMTKQKIYQWIDRHSSDRVSVKKNALHLFSGGQTSAPFSKKLTAIRENLRKGFYEAILTHPELKGRVKKSV